MTALRFSVEGISAVAFDGLKEDATFANDFRHHFEDLNLLTPVIKHRDLHVNRYNSQIVEGEDAAATVAVERAQLILLKVDAFLKEVWVSFGSFGSLDCVDSEEIFV